MLRHMRHEFKRVKDMIEHYRNQHEEANNWLWLDILNAAVAETGGQVVSVGYDSIGEPTIILLRVP